MTNISFPDALVRDKACDKAKEWVGQRDLASSWSEIDRVRDLLRRVEARIRRERELASPETVRLYQLATKRYATLKSQEARG